MVKAQIVNLLKNRLVNRIHLF